MSSGLRSWMRRISSSTPMRCRASVVRMKSSLLMFELLPELVMRVDDAVGELDREDAFFRRGALDLLPVLVRAGQEADVVAHAPAVARDHVGDDVLVHVPDVRVVVDVVDGGGDVELGHRTPKEAGLYSVRDNPSSACGTFSPHEGRRLPGWSLLQSSRSLGAAPCHS